MSRTYRRTNAFWLKRNYCVGYHDFSFHSGVEQYADWLRQETNIQWWHQHLAIKFSCHIDKVKERSQAWFHSDMRKGKWCAKSLYIHDRERRYRRKLNLLTAMSRAFHDVEEHDYSLSAKFNKIHPFTYS